MVNYPRCSMVLEYLPTFGWFLGFYVGKYSSTMDPMGMVYDTQMEVSIVMWVPQ